MMVPLLFRLDILGRVRLCGFEEVELLWMEDEDEFEVVLATEWLRFGWCCSERDGNSIL